MGKSQQGPNELPNPSFVTVSDTTGGVEPPQTPSWITVLTAPSIKGGDVAKIITCSLMIVATGRDQITLRLLKDGTEIVAADRFVQGIDSSPTTNWLLHAHWVDTAPGKGKPVYVVQAQRLLTTSPGTGNGRLTVHNA